jgi:hypothetical protein
MSTDGFLPGRNIIGSTRHRCRVSSRPRSRYRQRKRDPTHLEACSTIIFRGGGSGRSKDAPAGRLWSQKADCQCHSNQVISEQSRIGSKLWSASRARPAVIANPDTNHLHRRVAGGRDYLALRRCRPALDKAGDHGAIKVVSNHKQVFKHTARKASEQGQRAALFCTECWILRRRAACSRVGTTFSRGIGKGLGESPDAPMRAPNKIVPRDRQKVRSSAVMAASCRSGD